MALLFLSTLTVGFSGAILGTAGVAVYYFGHISADFIWYVAISAVIGRTRKFIKEQPYRIAIAALGALLIYFGITFIVGAISNLLFFAPFLW